MKLYPGGMPPDACTYYIFQAAKALSELHLLGYTHGDVKVPNFLLINGCRTLKLIDLDTVKKEEEIQISGTPGYAAPEVRTVR